jgi:SAM-dependent methyltransferase
MEVSTHYCCTEAGCDHAPLLVKDNGLRCPNGHVFPYSPGTKVPVFASEPAGTSEYTGENAATIHDNALRWVLDTFGIDEPSLRKRLISRLHLCKGQKLIVTGAGAGNDLPYLAQSLEGEGTIYAQDISQQMLLVGADRCGETLSNLGIDIYFSISDATNLPFDDSFFDVAYHFGGLNLFPDIRKGISEMNRVVKSGGTVVIGDEGIAPWLKHTEYGKMLIQNNALYAYDAPLSFLPGTAKSVNLTWEVGNCFYVIEFTVSDSLPHISVDIPHVGKRGGSIRTRYFGQLEGIDPSLRDELYAEAEELGLSRVEYLESLLRKSR